MSITLKPRNQPRQPGYYLCHQVGYPHTKPELIRVDPGDSLWMVGGGSVMPLSRCEHSALWSDRIEIDYPEGHGQT